MSPQRLFFFSRLFLAAIIFTFIPSNVKSDNDSKPTFRTLHSASELDYPPFAVVRQDGSATGFSVDLLQAVAHTVGMEVSFEVGPWHEIKQKLADGQLDVLPLVSYSQDRDKIFDFTAPYLRMQGTVFVRKGEKIIHGLADLKNKKILVMRGDAAHEFAISENLSDNLILTDSFEEALKRLSEGQHDAVIVQHVVGHQLIKKLGISNLVDLDLAKDISLKPVGKPLSGFEQKFCFAVREGEKELVAKLNEGLAVVIANGTYDLLYNRWFAPILPKPSISVQQMLKHALIVIVPILVLAAIVGIVYLKHEVSKKTLNLIQEIKRRKAVEEELLHLNKNLESQVAERTELAEDRARQLQVLMSDLILVEQRERRRLAEILHDHQQQLLVAAKMNCEILTKRTGLDQEQTIEQIIKLINQSIQASRSLTAELSPPFLLQGRLSDALEWLASWMQEKQGLTTEVNISAGIDPTQEDLCVMLYQAVRELLFNVVKHAGVKSVRLEMVKDDDNRLCVSVIDQGSGFEPDIIWEKAKNGDGFGLFHIRERLMFYGGSLEIESSRGKGASFLLVVPLEVDKQKDQ